MTMRTYLVNVLCHYVNVVHQYVDLRKVMVVAIILQTAVLIFNIQYTIPVLKIIKKDGIGVHLYTVRSSTQSLSSGVSENKKNYKSGNVTGNRSNLKPRCEMNVTTTILSDGISIPKCPLVSPYLRGKITLDLKEHDEIDIEVLNPLVKDGGTYKPKSCKARHKIAVIIPCRNRYRHLRVLLNNLHPFLQRQQIEYRIFVIDLVPAVAFNRALLLNIGFVEALKQDDYDCFIFHDVDLIPEHDNNIYSCAENPVHLAVAMNKFRYNLPYMDYFGGVTAMTKEQYVAVNGYSNKFFNWGGEDDDMFNRIRKNNMAISRYTPDVASYVMIRHRQEQKNPERDQLLFSGLHRWKEDGINSLKYSILKTLRKPLYTYMLADIDPKDKVYLKSTPQKASKSADDTLNPVLVNKLLFHVAYLMKTKRIGRSFFEQVKKNFIRLNTTSVTQEIVAGILHDMNISLPVVNRNKLMDMSNGERNGRIQINKKAYERIDQSRNVHPLHVNGVPKQPNVPESIEAARERYKRRHEEFLKNKKIYEDRIMRWKARDNEGIKLQNIEQG